MEIKFKAEWVEFGESLGGDLAQVSFYKVEPDDLFNSTTPGISITANYEFPYPISVEWNDGIEDGGGAKVVACSIKEYNLYIKLSNGLVFDIDFDIDKRKSQLIEKFLSII